MLEAVTKDLVFTISLKRSTQNLQLSTSWAGRLHHLLSVQRTCRASGDTSEPDQTHSGSRPPEVARLEVYNLAVYRWQVSQPFGGSDASWVDTSVRGDVVDLAARSTDVH